MRIVCSWYCEEHNVTVVYFQHRGPVREAVTPNADGSYTIFINDALSPEKRRSAFDHALSHIMAGDFWNERNLAEIEASAEGGAA